MSSPTSFSLLGRNLKLDTAQDAQPYITQLSHPQITHIELGGNTIGQHASQAIAAALPPHLAHLDAADIFTGRLITEIPQSLAAFSDTLAKSTAVTCVNFSDNAFGGRCADAMTALLSTNTSLQTLRLQNNGLGVTGGKIIAAALQKRASPSLKHLYIGRNRLENGSAPDIAAALVAQHGDSLESLAMPQNGIRPDGIVAICRSLGGAPNLRVLDLQDNTLVYKGSRALASAIPRWSKLHTLNLSDTMLRSRGGILIFNALAELGSESELETLQLQYCELNRTALEALARALEKGLPALRVLELHGNWADEGDDCVERIREQMEKRGAGEGLTGLDELEPGAEEDEEEEEEEDEDDDEYDDAKDENKDEGQEKDGPTAAADSLIDALSSKMTIGKSDREPHQDK